MGNQQDTCERGGTADALAMTIECLTALAEADTLEHPAGDAGAFTYIHCRTLRQFRDVVDRARTAGFDVREERGYTLTDEAADGSPVMSDQLRAYVGPNAEVSVLCSADAPAGHPDGLQDA